MGGSGNDALNEAFGEIRVCVSVISCDGVRDVVVIYTGGEV